jgi:hypothetical protein
MKYAIVILDGASGDPLACYGGATTLEVAHTPHLDALARAGIVGLAHNVPAGLEPSSNVACTSIVGYDPADYPIGRGALELAALGIELAPDQVALRVNLTHVSPAGIMVSYSTDNIGNEDAHALADELAVSPVFNKIVTKTSKNVDVIFTAHTHKAYAWDGPVPGSTTATRPVLQTGSYGDNVGVVTLSIDSSYKVSGYTQSLVPRRTDGTDASLAATYPRVADVQAIVDPALAYAAAQGSVVKGQVSQTIGTAFTGGDYTGPDGTYTGGTRDNRGEASPLGTLVGNALVASMADLPEPPVIGVTNPGGLRAELVGAPGTGNVPFSLLKSILPYDNNLSVVTLTGAQLKTMLEQQWQRDAAGAVPSRAYLELGLSDNVSYTYTEAVDPDPAHGGAMIGTVTSLQINGAEVVDTQTYKVGTFSFLAAGGDNFRVMAQGQILDTGRLDWEGWVDYITAASAPGPIAPDFRRHGANVAGLAASYNAGDPLNLTVSHLDVPSTGAKQITSLALNLGGKDLGTFPVTNGTATIATTIPTGISGDAKLTITADPYGAVYAIGTNVVGGPDPNPTPTATPTPDSPTQTPAPEPTCAAAQVSPTVTATTVKKSIKVGQKPQVKVTVTVPKTATWDTAVCGHSLTGKITVKYTISGKKNTKTEALKVATSGKSGTATVKLPVKLKKGAKYSIKVTYKANSSAVKDKTVKAGYKASLTVKLAKKSIAKSVAPKVTITVKSAGVAKAKAKATITVTNAKTGKKVTSKTVTLKGKNLTAKSTVTLKKLAKGKYKVKVTYKGTTMVLPRTSGAKALTVK